MGLALKMETYSAERARSLLRLTTWQTPQSADLDAQLLWAAVEAGVLVYASTDPSHSLTGRPRAIESAAGRPLARRSAVWPTVAVETAVEIAPMPFMPRGRDLEGAETVGLRWASLERGHEVFGLTITGTEATGRRMLELLSRLNGRKTHSEILADFDRRDRHEVSKTLDLLDDAGLLEAIDGPVGPAVDLTSPGRPQVTWLGHAGVLLQSRATSILVDPVFFAPSEPPDRWDTFSRFDPRSLPKIDAVLITHGDNDHLNANSLAMIDRRTPILIPRCARYPSAFQVDVKGVLRVLGFTSLIEMPVGSGYRVGDFEVTAWPFDGEDWGLDLPQVTYLAESRDLSAYFSADARRMDDVMEALGLRDRRIDIAFMGVSGNAEPHVTSPELGYGNFYADWIPPERHQAWVQHCAGPEDAVRGVSLMRPRFAFGYAAGGAPYIQTAYSDWGDHPTFARLLTKASLDVDAVDLPLGRPVGLEDLEAQANR